MARDRGEKPDITGGSSSSDDLLKQAWQSMGRTETGDRVEESESPSGKLAEAATTSQVGRTETAEQIAQMLLQETERRQQPEPRQPRQEPERRQPPPPQRPAPDRPRRATPTQLPPPRPQAPPPRPRPTAQPQPEQPRSRRGVGWIAVAVFFLISSIIGSFFSEETGGGGVDVNIPEVTVDFGDLTSTSLASSAEGTRVNIRDVEVGQCIESLPPGTIIDEVTVVSCDEPHQYELFANTFVDADDFPGDDVFTLAADACIPLFRNYVGEDYIDSAYYIDPISPTAEGWKSGDRAVNCLLYLWPDGAEDAEVLTGSARGSGNTQG